MARHPKNNETCVCACVFTAPFRVYMSSSFQKVWSMHREEVLETIAKVLEVGNVATSICLRGASRKRSRDVLLRVRQHVPDLTTWRGVSSRLGSEEGQLY